MILIPTSGSFLIAFLIIAIYVFVKSHKEKAESGYYTQEAKDRRAKLQEQKYAQKRRKMKKDVAYNYIKTYKLFQDNSIAKFYIKIDNLFDKQIKHEKSLVQKADYMDELKKTREEFDEEIKQIEQDIKENIEQEAERLETIEEYSYGWSESKAKIEISNTYIERVHKGYEKYLKKRPYSPGTQEDKHQA